MNDNRPPPINVTPPSSEQAEQRVLGCILLAADTNQHDLVREMIPKLGNQDFHDHRLKEVWSAIYCLHADRKDPTPSSVVQWLKDKGLLELVGGLPYVTGLPEIAGSVGSFDGSLGTVKEKTRDRLRLDTLNRMAVVSLNSGMDEGAKNAALSDALSAMMETVSSGGATAAEAFESSVIHCTVLAAMEIPPRQFIIEPYFKEGDLGFIHGPRGLGKTWYSLTMAITAASGRSPVPFFTSHKPRPVLYIDGEMTLDAIRTRTVSLGAGSSPLFVLSHEHFFQKTGKTFNLADPAQQDGIVKLCLSNGIKALVLDNLSCLVSGVAENEADDWEIILAWLLTLRRHGIAVVVVAHSGRNGEMRGTSRREDAASWVLRLDESATQTAPGANFLASFTKNRHATEAQCPALDWSFSTGLDGKVSIGCRLLDDLEQLRQVLTDGLSRCSDVCEATGWSKAKTSKVARKAMTAGWLKLEGRDYRLR